MASRFRCDAFGLDGSSVRHLTPRGFKIAGLTALLVTVVWPAIGLASHPQPYDPGAEAAARGGGRSELIHSTRAQASTIENLDTSETFSTIQDAIDDTDTLDGHTIEVQGASVTPHAEGAQILVNKAVTIKGAAGGAIIAPVANTGSGGDARGWFLMTVAGVHFQDLAFDGTGFNISQALRFLEEGSADNCSFDNIKFSTYVGIAVVGFKNLTVTDCSFANIERIGVILFGTDVTAGVVDGCTYTGKGVGDHLDYAVELGAGAVATIRNSTVTECRGVASSDGSTSAGLLMTTFFGAGTAGNVENNFLNDNTNGMVVGYDTTDTTVAIILGNDVSANDSHGVGRTSGSSAVVDASGNWWGSNVAGTVAAAADDDVDYTPWLDVGTDTSADPGFQGDFSVLNVDDDSPQIGTYAAGRVQEGVALVSASTVNILPGTYEEQVIIDMDDVSLIGSGSGTNPLVDSIIVSPVSLTVSFNNGPDNYPIIGVLDATGASIENLRVDGAGRGNGNYRFEGIAFWNGDGSVSDCVVTGIRETPFNGNQHGTGIYSSNNTGGPYTIDVSGCTVEDYQKNGMALGGDGLTADVSDCTTTGAGATGVTAQNGIQIGVGAGGSITGCTVSANLYTGGGFASTGLLLINGSNVDASDNDVLDNYPGVYYQDMSGTFDGNLVSNQDPDSWDGMYVFNTGFFPLASSDRDGPPLPSPVDGGTGTAARGTRAAGAMSVTATDNEYVGHDKVGSGGLWAFSYGPTSVLTAAGNTIHDWDLGVVVYDFGVGGSVDVTANFNCIFSNESFGFYADDLGVQNAESNWWGDPSGPLDSAGADEAGNPPCFDASTIANADGLGDTVSDLTVDYCPWLVSSPCEPGCGNGIVEAGEECDDGNADDTDACLSTCENATCGDGFVWAGMEDCDDAGESATCDDDCTFVACGDGNLNETAGEQCDDGNTDDGDFCSSGCIVEGACCHFNGTCTDYMVEEECLSESFRVWTAETLCEDTECQPIPTVSEWGLIIMTLLGATLGSLIFRTRKPVVT